MNENKSPAILSENLVILDDNHADRHSPETILDENTIILASGDTYSLLDLPALKKAVKKSGLSYEDIADQMDISVSSIYKLFSKKSKSPSFYNTVMICKAVGASVDELCGLSRPQTPDKGISDRLDKLEKTVEHQNRLIADLLQELKRSSPASHEDY